MHRAGSHLASEVVLVEFTKPKRHGYKLELPTEMKIHLMFHVSLLQPSKGEPLTHEVPPPPPIIVDNSDGSYFIDSIDDMQ